MTFNLKATALAFAGAVLGFSVINASAAQAATVYSEDFTGQNGKGAIGATSDTAGVSWSIDLNDAALFDNSDFFAVVNGVFSAQDTNAGCATSACTGAGGGTFPAIPGGLPTWLSPVINISGFTNLQFSLDASGAGTTYEVGGGLNSEDDYIVSYILNGGSPVTAADLITANGPFPNQTVTQSVANGNTLQILVAMNTYAGAETLGLDNVIVTGDVIPNVVPTPALLPGLLGLGAAALRKKQSA